MQTWVPVEIRIRRKSTGKFSSTILNHPRPFPPPSNHGGGSISRVARKPRVMPSQFPSRALHAWNSIPSSFIHFPAKHGPFRFRYYVNLRGLSLCTRLAKHHAREGEEILMGNKLRDRCKNPPPWRRCSELVSLINSCESSLHSLHQFSHWFLEALYIRVNLQRIYTFHNNFTEYPKI